MTQSSLRILFHVSLTTMLRHFESVIVALAERGHTVRIASPDRHLDLPTPPALAGHARVTFLQCPGRRADSWTERIVELRTIRDYLRYLDRRFVHAPKLRQRALRKMTQAVTHGERSHLVAWCPQCDARLVDDDVGRMLTSFRKRGLRNLSSLLALVEETIPSDPAIEDFLREEDPDVMLVTPLIWTGSSQPDYVKSARAIGLPVGFPVFSWDNLSTKGLIQVPPDRVMVWNERQRTEAIEMHGMAAEQVVVTGAPRFDEFFRIRPRQSREAFCAEYGFDPAQPIVMYLCSSEFVAHQEREFVLRWIDEIRQAPTLRACNVLVRPHPREQGQWKRLEAPPRVAVGFPQAMNADESLYESLHHSAAAVGLNTSAQLEAAIVGRPVLTILAPEFAEGQQGTLHFSYLLKEGGGFVEVAEGFDAHRQHLAAAVSGAHDPQAIRDFVQRFLRPHGLDRPATGLMVDAIESLAAVHPERRAGLASSSP
jgi:hypothetical protein